MFLRVVPWYGEPVTVMKDDYVEVKSSGFQDAPRKALQAEDDVIDLNHTLVVDMHIWFLNHRLDVLANDILPSPTAATILGVALSAEGPFVEAIGPAQEDPSDYMAWGVGITRDAKYLLYYYQAGVFHADEEWRTFYYLLSDGHQSSVGRVSASRWDPVHL